MCSMLTIALAILAGGMGLLVGTVAAMLAWAVWR